MRFIPKSKFTWLLIAVFAYGYITSVEEESIVDEAPKKGSISSSIENSHFFETPVEYIVDKIQSNKTVKCWGKNSRGELGKGSRIDSNIPAEVLNVSNVVEICLHKTGEFMSWVCLSLVKQVQN